MSITRLHAGSRMSQAVIHAGTVYLSGQVAHKAAGQSSANQTKAILEGIDGLLAEAGTDKSKLLSATIWLTDIRDFSAMNEVWDSWIDPENPPVRACVESRLAATQFTVEIQVTAAL